MKQTSHEDICDGCGANKPVLEVDCNEFCEECRAIADMLHRDRERTARIMKLTKFTCTEGTINSELTDTARGKSNLPDVLDAVRYRTKDRDANSWYVSISEIEGKPVEIFASTAFDRDHHLQSRISNLTTITRLISLILRHVFLGEVLTLEKTIKQIHRSSRQQNDLPEMLTQILKQYPRKVK